MHIIICGSCSACTGMLLSPKTHRTKIPKSQFRSATWHSTNDPIYIAAIRGIRIFSSWRISLRFPFFRTDLYWIPWPCCPCKEWHSRSSRAHWRRRRSWSWASCQWALHPAEQRGCEAYKHKWNIMCKYPQLRWPQFVGFAFPFQIKCCKNKGYICFIKIIFDTLYCMKYFINISSTLIIPHTLAFILGTKST